MSDYKVKDESLAEAGAKRLDWARDHMPVLAKIRERYSKEKPLEGLRVGACLHVTKETGILMEVLRAGGAEVALCASNPLSTQDDVAAALAKQGVSVFAWHGCTNDEYYECLNKVLDFKPDITTDDGADVISTIHSKRTELLDSVLAGQEETTTGVIRLKAMAADGALKFPVIAVNDTPTKHYFDNVFGTGQSTLDGIIRATEDLIAGKTVVVAGFGYCGRGFALRAHGMGANIIVTEVDSVKAIEAHLFGYRVMKMDDAASIGDIFVTATGDCNVIRGRHFEKMKNGAVVANTGHFDIEINVPELEALAKSEREIKPEVDEFTLANGNKVYLLARGRLVNLSCGVGHPSEVMDMSFANQALVTEWLKSHAKELENRVYDVPKEIDDSVAALKLEGMGLQIDELTAEQKEYLSSWQHGT